MGHDTTPGTLKVGTSVLYIRLTDDAQFDLWMGTLTALFDHKSKPPAKSSAGAAEASKNPFDGAGEASSKPTNPFEGADDGAASAVLESNPFDDDDDEAAPPRGNPF